MRSAHVGFFAALAKAGSLAGSVTSDVFPPAGTTADPELFPPESVVGYPGITATGAEPGAIQTAASYPYNRGASGEFPLVSGKARDDEDGSFDLKKSWGNLSPWYSVDSADYGLPEANPLIPDGCNIIQMHLLYRHGARYPTDGAAPATFAEKIRNATKKGDFEAKGDLSFLNDWTFKLGSELLTVFGRSQLYNLGIAHRQLYGELLNNFTDALPVFRTESQDRMVKSTHNFAAGFFGAPEYLDQVSIEILVEENKVNNSGAPYYVCPNSNEDDKGYIGDAVAAEFAQNAFNQTMDRLNDQLSGLTLTPSDVVAMLQLCSYETVALGYSVFCGLFTKEDYLNYEYYYDLEFYYNNGPGSPVAAAQGKAYLEEYLGRFKHHYPDQSSTSALNETFDSTSTYFPLNQSIYADATHEVVVLDTLTAFNLSALFKGPPLSLDKNEKKNSFSASKVVPFATHFTTQVLECPAYQPTKQIRFLLNDAVIPIADSYDGCKPDPNGLCSFDHVVSVLQKRSDEIDFDYDCFHNFTAKPGVDYNGRAPRD